MLQDMQKQLFHIHRAVNVGEEIHEERRISQVGGCTCTTCSYEYCTYMYMYMYMYEF